MDNHLEDDLVTFETEEKGKKINPKLIHAPLDDYHGEDKHETGFEAIERREKGEWQK